MPFVMDVPILPARLGADFWRLRRAPWRWLLAAAGSGGLLFASGAALAWLKGMPIGYLLRDPNAIAGQPFYYGMLQYAGAILLAATGGILLFAGGVVGRTCGRRAGVAFLVPAGLLSLLLAADDLFQLHENLWRIGLGETEVFLLYAALAAAIVVCNLHRVGQSSLSLGVTSASCFAGAILLDASPALTAAMPKASEDLLELVGICFFSAYFVKCSFDSLRGCMTERSAR